MSKDHENMSDEKSLASCLQNLMDWSRAIIGADIRYPDEETEESFDRYYEAMKDSRDALFRFKQKKEEEESKLVLVTAELDRTKEMVIELESVINNLRNKQCRCNEKRPIPSTSIFLDD